MFLTGGFGHTGFDEAMPAEGRAAERNLFTLSTKNALETKVKHNETLTLKFGQIQFTGSTRLSGNTTQETNGLSWFLRGL